jgi:hypothetical protein
MELQGKVIAETPERSGTSARGEWKAKDFVIETHEQYPHKMSFSVFGEERLQRFNIQVGQEVLVSFDIDAHEHNGRWYNNIRAYDVRQVDPASLGVQGAPVPPAMGNPATPVTGTNQSQAPFPPQPATTEESTDDLPF